MWKASIFASNGCKILLKHVDTLIWPEFVESDGNFKLIPLVSAFKVMEKNVYYIFSTQQIDAEFGITRRATGVSEGLKVWIWLKYLWNCFEYQSGLC